MIICQCTGTTDRDIARLRAEGVTTTAGITRETGAGACCDSCRVEIGRLIGDRRTNASASPAGLG